MDTVFKSLNKKGRYHVIQILLISLVSFPGAFQLLSNIFTCQTVPHSCVKTNETDDQVNVTSGQCDVTYWMNSTMVKQEACLGGYDFHLPVERSAVSQFELVCDRSNLARLSQTLVIAGQGVGAIIATFFSDRWGRKTVLVISNFGLGVFGVCIAISPSYIYFAVFKFIVGAFQQGVVINCATMMLELLTTSDRKLAAAITGVVWSVCVMTLALVAFLLRDNSWRTLQIVLSSTSLFVVLQILYLDESLRWMVANGKIKQAVKVIKKAVKMNKCDEDVVLKIFQDHVEQVQSQNVLENFDIKSLVNMEKRESLYQQNFDTQKVLCEQSNGQINMILFGADHQNTNCLKKNDHQETLSQPDEHQETLSQPADHQEALSQPADPQETLSQPADPQETLSQPADHQATLSQPANHQETLTQIADHQETLSQLADHQETVSQPADHQETVSQPADHQETLSQLADHQETLSQLADHQETLSQTADHQETLSQTADHQETLSKTADHQGTVPQKADHQETLSQPADHQETLSQTADHQETLSKTADHQGTVPQTADYQETLSQPADHQETLTQTTDHQNTLCQQSVDYHYYQEYVKQQKDIGDTKPHLELSEFSQCKAVNSEQNLVSSGEDKLSQNSQIIHSEQMSFFDLVKDRRLLVTSLVNGLLWFTTAVGYFGIYFTSTTLVGNRFLNFFLTALMEAPSNLMLYSILDRFGRRISTGGVFAILGISVLASGICRHLQQVYNDDIFAYLALGFSLLGMLGASSCFGIVFLYTPEMFPTNIRNQALGVSSFVGRLGGMLAPFLGLLAEQAIWLSGLLIASLCTLVCLTLRFLPETNGRELPQSLQELKRW